MKKILLILFPLVLAIAVFASLVYFLNKDSGKGALQVTSQPKSNVFLDGKLLGTTPLCKCQPDEMLPVGKYTIRVEPQEGNLVAFEEKITIAKSILTVVDRTFAQGGLSEGSIISLTALTDKNATQLLVVSFPQSAHIAVDSAASGSTPVLLKNLTESDHEVTLTKDGYRDKVIRIRIVKGYTLSITAYLGVNPNVSESLVGSKTPAVASASAAVVPAPAKVEILQTPTGFLRVRESNSLNAAEIGRVSPGDTLVLVDESPGWYKITLANGTVGWISSQYATKQ